MRPIEKGTKAESEGRKAPLEEARQGVARADTDRGGDATVVNLSAEAKVLSERMKVDVAGPPANREMPVAGERQDPISLGAPVRTQVLKRFAEAQEPAADQRLIDTRA